ncbi:hypothetical protein V492_03829 [Pseudogymnoascus sp. VKM F-4246]|nr:hypothetical protein V492_03829 [Pseudogymnoascus sp. VKM F-4246]
MEDTSLKRNITVIDSEKSLVTLIDSIASLAVDPPSLYINLEGISLSRHGSISILSVHVAPTKETYLIDIHTLNGAAFSTTTNDGTSLKTILETSTIPKVIFDIRNGSDALFALFEVSVDGIIDVQLMEMETHWYLSHKVAPSLVSCINTSSSISSEEKAEWHETKQDGYRFLAPWCDGQFEVLNERPIKPEIARCCGLDVELLVRLYGDYNSELQKSTKGRQWQDRIIEETKLRIKLSQSPDYYKGTAIA